MPAAPLDDDGRVVVPLAFWLAEVEPRDPVLHHPAQAAEARGERRHPLAARIESTYGVFPVLLPHLLPGGGRDDVLPVPVDESELAVRHLVSQGALERHAGGEGLVEDAV